MITIGRVYIKTKGKETGKKCVIVDVLDNNLVLIDGDVKRRKCNLSHLEPTQNVLNIEKGASTTHVKEAMKKAGLLEEQKISTIKKRGRKGGERPKKRIKQKEEKKTKSKPAKKKTEAEIVEESLVRV